MESGEYYVHWIAQRGAPATVNVINSGATRDISCGIRLQTVHAKLVLARGHF